jgi:aryl-alcohol dehydrogenase-like predicted oxidoreductase
MLNREQYKSLKKIIKQIKIKYPGVSIISNWSIAQFNLSNKEIESLKTINFTPVDSVINKFKWAFGGEIINIDPNIIAAMNEYKEKHGLSAKAIIVISVLGTIVTIGLGLLAFYTFFK